MEKVKNIILREATQRNIILIEAAKRNILLRNFFEYAPGVYSFEMDCTEPSKNFNHKVNMAYEIKRDFLLATPYFVANTGWYFDDNNTRYVQYLIYISVPADILKTLYQIIRLNMPMYGLAFTPCPVAGGCSRDGKTIYLTMCYKGSDDWIPTDLIEKDFKKRTKLTLYWGGYRWANIRL